MNEQRNTDPLIDSVDALRRFDPDDVRRGTADTEVLGRVRNLLVAVAAIGELRDRDEDPTPPALRAEISAITRRDELAGIGFVVKRVHVDQVADGLRSAGDVVRAETV